MSTCITSCANYFLVYFILLIVIWSYYAYVVEMCIIYCQNIAQKVFYIIIFHFSVGIFLYAYFKAVTEKPKPVPVQFYLDSEEHESALELSSDRVKFSTYLEELIQKKGLPIKTRDFHNQVRFCSICQLIKPDRAHHCSTCNTCLLRMDHHCPWVGTCVAFHNHKFFIQFLGYGTLYCVLICATSVEFALHWWTNNDGKHMRGINFLLLVVISVMFGLVQISLCSYHIYLTMNNMTTLESMRKSVFVDPEIKSFDIGKGSNLKQILGEGCGDWFFPTVATQGNGYDYPVWRNMLDYQSLEAR